MSLPPARICSSARPASTWKLAVSCALTVAYQIGYPFLLWLMRATVIDNAFLAARIVALLSGTVLLVAAYFLGRTLYGHGVGLLVLFLLVLNRWTSEYSLSLGTDMPFIAAWTLALLALMTVRQSPVRALLAGFVCGLAFLIRHPGILLLPLGCGLVLWPEPWNTDNPVISFPVISYRQALLGVMVVLGFIITALPQLIVNIDMTDRPFFSQQAKNIWLAVYGNTDWTRWGEAANDVTLRAVIAHDPGRFVANWWSNIRAFVGTGGEDTSEFGRGIALRLLSFPANLLAGVGLALWLLRGDRRERWLLSHPLPLDRRIPTSVVPAALYGLPGTTVPPGTALYGLPALTAPRSPVYTQRGRGHGRGRGYGGLPFYGSVALPYYGLGDEMDISTQAPPPVDSNTQVLANEIDKLTEQVQQLTAERQAQAAQAPAFQPEGPTQQAETLPPEPSTILVLRDGKKVETDNYAVMGATFWNFSAHPVQRIPDRRIDVSASRRRTSLGA